MSMRVFIAGGSGLIGRQLAKSLLNSGHHPVILSRHADAVRRDPVMRAYQVIPGDPCAPGKWQEAVDGCDAVVNLSGHGIFNERWNVEVKRKIRDSRVHSAENLITAIKGAARAIQQRPHQTPPPPRRADNSPKMIAAPNIRGGVQICQAV